MADFILCMEFKENQLPGSIDDLVGDLEKFCSKNELYALIDDPYEFTVIRNSDDPGTIVVQMAGYYYEEGMSAEESMSFIEEEQEENINVILNYLAKDYSGVNFEINLAETG